MVSQAELILRVITLWFLVLSQFLETVWVPLTTIDPRIDKINFIDVISNCGGKVGSFNRNVVKHMIFRKFETYGDIFCYPISLFLMSDDDYNSIIHAPLYILT